MLVEAASGFLWLVLGTEAFARLSRPPRATVCAWFVLCMTAIAFRIWLPIFRQNFDYRKATAQGLYSCQFGPRRFRLRIVFARLFVWAQLGTK